MIAEVEDKCVLKEPVCVELIDDRSNLTVHLTDMMVIPRVGVPEGRRVGVIGRKHN